MTTIIKQARFSFSFFNPDSDLGTVLIMYLFFITLFMKIFIYYSMNAAQIFLVTRRQNCIVLYCIVLYCIVLYCIVLYCIVLGIIQYNFG